MSNLTRTQIYIDKDVLQEAKIKASTNGKSLSELIREAIDDFLKKPVQKSKPKLRITKLDSKTEVNISSNHNIIYDN